MQDILYFFEHLLQNYPLLFWQVISVLPPFVLSLIRHQVLHGEITLIKYYVWASLVFELINNGIAIQNKDNSLVYNIFSVFECLLLGTYYYQILHSPTIRKGLITVLVVFMVGSIVNLLWGEGSGFNANTYMVAALIMLVVSLLYYYQLLTSLEVPFLLKSPHFWINSGVLLYFSGSFFVFMFAGLILSIEFKPEFEYWNITALLNITFRIILAISFWLVKR